MRPRPPTIAAKAPRRGLGGARPAPRFLRDEGAAAAVEFALVSTPLVLLLFGTLQVSIMFFAGQALQTFLETTGRAILVGAAQQNGYTQAQYKASLCAQLPSLFSCSNLYVDVTTVSSFSNANTTNAKLTYDASGNVTNKWNYNLGASGDIVVLRLMYLWPVIGLPPNVTFSNQAGGGRLLLATAVFQNEQTN